MLRFWPRRRFRLAALLLAALGAAILLVPRAWLVTNDITTGRHPGYPDLQDRWYAAPPDRALTVAEAAARGLPRWRVVSVDSVAHEVHVAVRTAVGGFTDDLVIRIAPAGARSRVTVRSRSRMGRGDLGENARHIRAIQRAMDARLPRVR